MMVKGKEGDVIVLGVRRGYHDGKLFGRRNLSALFSRGAWTLNGAWRGVSYGVYLPIIDTLGTLHPTEGTLTI